MGRTARGVACVVLLASTTVAACDGGADSGTGDDTIQQPSWSASLPAEVGAPLMVQAFDSSVVVRAEHGVVVVDGATGDTRWWQSTGEETASVGVSGDLVALGWTSVESTSGVRVFDLGTGEEVAALVDLTVTAVTVSADSVFTLANGVGEAASSQVNQVTAYDLSTGAQRWRRDLPTSSYATLLEGTADSSLAAPSRPVVVAAFQHVGQAGVIRSLDATTGQDVASFELGSLDQADPTSDASVLSEGTLLAWSVDDETCGAELAGYGLSTGGLIWSQEIERWTRTDSNPPVCVLGMAVRSFAPRLLVLDADSVPLVLDSDSGEVEWTGTTDEYPLTASADTVVTRTEQGTGDLVGYDITTGETLWTIDLEDEDNATYSSINQNLDIVGDSLILTVTRNENIGDSDDQPTFEQRERVVVYDLPSQTTRWTSTASVSQCGTTTTGVFGCQSDTALASHPSEVRLYPL